SEEAGDEVDPVLQNEGDPVPRPKPKPKKRGARARRTVGDGLEGVAAVNVNEGDLVGAVGKVALEQVDRRVIGPKTGLECHAPSSHRLHSILGVHLLLRASICKILLVIMRKIMQFRGARYFARGTRDHLRTAA